MRKKDTVPLICNRRVPDLELAVCSIGRRRQFLIILFMLLAQRRLSDEHY